MIFDTHAHYNDKQFDSDREELLASMKDHNVGTILNVGASVQDCRDTVELAHRWPMIYGAVGVHPDHTGELNEEIFAWLRETAGTDDRIVAIGEIGLDYHWNIESHETQKKWFIRQLELAGKLDLPVSIHSRDAAQDTLEIMKTYGQGLTGSIHCFSYSPEIAEEYVKMGFCIGTGGVVTFKNAKKLKNTVARTPMEYLLLETDCPYLAPSPHRGERNHSIYLDFVADTVAQLKGISKEEVIRQTEANARRVFLKAKN
ncbi:MAG: TatD family hydrolase [Eubacterium sp.]|jgi:TatD DNase family protein